MSVESDLKKDGIEVIKELDKQKINEIAKSVSSKIYSAFPNYGLSEEDLYNDISNLHMYIAKMPEGMSEANYFYKNSSIYFNEHLLEQDLDKFAIHECIHHIQERKDKNNYLLRMGLCDYSGFKIFGLGLNEAAVQLMTAKALNTPSECVKYFNILFRTNSPSYYPMECCLVTELAYIVGEDVLFESTINSNDNFKIKFSELAGSKAYRKIQDNIDRILMDEEKIVRINNKIFETNDKGKKIEKLQQRIENLKKRITTTFIQTQNIILSSYFDNEFNRISTIEGIEKYRRKLYDFKDYLGSMDKYVYYNDYYVEKMMALEDKTEILENNITSTATALVEKKTSKVVSFFKYIREIFAVRKLKDEEEKN